MHSASINTLRIAWQYLITHAELFINFLQWEKQSISSNVIPVLLTILQFLAYQILILAEIFSVNFPKANQEIHSGTKKSNLLLEWYIQRKNNNL